jgi:hypothetical protein
MKKLIISIIMIILFTSCKDKEKYEFINNIIKNPDQTEQIIKNSKWKYGHYIEVWFDSVKYENDFLSEFKKRVKDHFSNNVIIEKDYKTKLFVTKPNSLYSTIPSHSIVIKGSEDERIEFYWIYENNEWILRHINYYYAP